MRKIFFIVVISILAYFVLAKNVNFNPFIKGVKKNEVNTSLKTEFTQNEFLSRLPNIENTIRLGGGNEVIYYDTLLRLVQLQSYFLNNDNSLQLDKNYFQSLSNKKPKSRFIINQPIPSINMDVLTKKYGSINFDRGFYLGIYRELMENISLWEERYGNLIFTFGSIQDFDSKQTFFIISIQAYIKGILNDVVYLLPNSKSDQHLYDYMITDTTVLKEPLSRLLNSLGHVSQSSENLQMAWKIHPKKYELRKLRWNFD